MAPHTIAGSHPRRDVPPRRDRPRPTWRSIHACHTSAFEISNGLPDDFSSLTRLLPDLSPVDRTNMPRMTWPLRFTPTATAGTSPLLRASPPAHPHRYSIPPLSDVRDSPSRRPGGAAVSGHAFSRSIRAQPGRAHVASMPDTTWPIDGHPPGSSRDRVQTPVLVSTVPISTLHRQ